jgi:hypothetical protein
MVAHLSMIYRQVAAGAKNTSGIKFHGHNRQLYTFTYTKKASIPPKFMIIVCWFLYAIYICVNATLSILFIDIYKIKPVASGSDICHLASGEHLRPSSQAHY